MTTIKTDRMGLYLNQMRDLLHRMTREYRRQKAQEFQAQGLTPEAAQQEVSKLFVR